MSQIILMSLSFKAEKKSKKKKGKRKEKMIYSGKKTEHCDTRTHDIIRRNFKKSSSRKINLFILNNEHFKISFT